MSLPAATLPEDLDLSGLLKELFRRLRETCPDLEIEVRDAGELELARRVAAAVADPATGTGLLPDQLAQAEAAAAELLATNDPEALLSADPRVASPLVARLLIRRARTLAHCGMKGGVDVATLAILATGRIDGSLWGRDYVRSTLLQARGSRVEALRSIGRLEAAHREAIELVDDLEPCDSPRLRGDVHLLAGRVRRAQGKLDDAAAFYFLARDAYELSRDGRRLGRGLLHLADVYREHLQVDLAVDAARRAAMLLGSNSDREAHVAALHNLAIYLCDAGSPVEARETLEASRQVRGLVGTPGNRLKSLWIEGRIHEQIGDLETAERLYGEAREGLAAIPMAPEAGAAGVDLMGVLVQRQRYAEAFHASSWLGVLFRRHPIPQPALFALLAFREAVQAAPPDPGQLVSCLASLRSLLRRDSDL